jgi:hypothetical protein
MGASDTAADKPNGKTGDWLARVFWFVACADTLLFLASMWNVWTYPRGQFDGLVIFVLLVLLGVMAATMGIIALIRRPAAYGIALTLVAAPLLLVGLQFAKVTW